MSATFVYALYYAIQDSLEESPVENLSFLRKTVTPASFGLFVTGCQVYKWLCSMMELSSIILSFWPSGKEYGAPLTL